MQSSSEQNGYPEDTNTHLVSHIHPTSKHKQCLSRGLVSVKLCVAHPKGDVLTVNLEKRYLFSPPPPPDQEAVSYVEKGLKGLYGDRQL